MMPLYYMDSDREYADHWNFPCEANGYDGIPEHLLDIYVLKVRFSVVSKSRKFTVKEDHRSPDASCSDASVVSF